MWWFNLIGERYLYARQTPANERVTCDSLPPSSFATCVVDIYIGRASVRLLSLSVWYRSIHRGSKSSRQNSDRFMRFDNLAAVKLVASVQGYADKWISVWVCVCVCVCACFFQFVSSSRVSACVMNECCMWVCASASWPVNTFYVAHILQAVFASFSDIWQFFELFGGVWEDVKVENGSYRCVLCH